MDGLTVPDEFKAAGLMVPVPSVMPALRPFVCAEYITAEGRDARYSDEITVRRELR